MTSVEKEKIWALIIGGSGHGKSEFILSFINSDDRRGIPASGNGQTTRISMEYHINCENKTELKIKTEMKSKEKFVEERIQKIDRILECEDLPGEEYAYEELLEKIIKDDAFFNIEEFGETIAKVLEDKYRSIFSMEFFKSKAKKEQGEFGRYTIDDRTYDEIRLLLRDEEEMEKQFVEACANKNFEGKDLMECFKLYFEYTYKCCMNLIESNYTKEVLENLVQIDIEEVSTFFKTEDKKISYSSLIDKIIIETSIAEHYKSIFQNLRVGEIIFIDTYGLDHEELGSKEVIERRYHQLLNKEYPSIKTIIYIRNANNSQAATDLQQNIPLIFKSTPTVVPYVVFTKIDKLEEEGKELFGSKAYKEIKKIKNKVGKSLEEKGVSKVLIENRIKTLMENCIGYCSYVGNDEEKYTKYLDNNMKGISNIFEAIRYKRYLGTNLVEINKIRIKDLKDTLDMNEIFKSKYKFNGDYPNRTKGALAKNLRKDILGFDGSTTDSTYWSDVMAKSLNERFKKIVSLEKFKWEEYFLSENILPTLSELFLIFAESVYKCSENMVRDMEDYINKGICINCSKKESCLKEIMYEEKREIIKNESRDTLVGDWLNDIYNFSDISKETKEKIQNLINSRFKEKFVKEARNHNARILALEFKEDDTQNEIEERLKMYYKLDSNLTGEEKLEFEQMIKLYQQ